MAKVEAALIVSPEALPPRKLMQVAMLSDPAEVAATIAELNQAFDQTRSPFRIERVASGFRLFTRSAYALWLGKLHQRR
jgi:segregation and condensation protein B